MCYPAWLSPWAVSFCLFAWPHLSDGYRYQSTENLENGSQMTTVHDIDALESLDLGYEFHAEENCTDCYQGDMLLPPMEATSWLQTSGLAGWSSGPWPNNTVVYQWQDGIDVKARQVTLEAMQVWESKTCIKFVESSHEPLFKHPVVIGSSKSGCNAHVGYFNAHFQTMNLGGPGCRNVGTALHELGHVIGLSHEHERWDREDYIEIHLENVPEPHRQWFEVKSRRQGDAKYLPYDLSSIMHYDAWAFAHAHNYSNGKTASITVKRADEWGNCKIGQRSQISGGDTLTVAHLYECANRPCSSVTWTGNQTLQRTMNMQTCAEELQDLSCQDKECIEGWTTCHKCSALAGQKHNNGQEYCTMGLVQRSCPRSCGLCASLKFC